MFPNKEKTNESNKDNHLRGDKKSRIPEEDLLSCDENLDRRSPDLWPEKLPGFRAFVASSPQLLENDKAVPDWMKGLEKEDMELLWSLGKLNQAQLFEKVKELYNLAVELGIEEDREISRGKFLEVLDDRN